MKTSDQTFNYINILNTLFAGKEMTANECIDAIYKKDLMTGAVNARHWKYYVHLNKLFTNLEKMGEIKVVGTKKGPTKKLEKVWSCKK